MWRLNINGRSIKANAFPIWRPSWFGTESR